MPGGKPIIAQAIHRADELKFVIGKAKDVQGAADFISGFGFKGHVCLQPLSKNAKATQHCVRACLEKGWRLSPQMHKYLDLP